MPPSAWFKAIRHAQERHNWLDQAYGWGADSLSARGQLKGGRMKVKNTKNEQVALAKLNEIFRDAMLKRLFEKQKDGWFGWELKA